MNVNVYYLLLAFLVLTSCRKPEACFTASLTTVQLGQEVLFNDCSTDGAKTKINFGDGSREKTFVGIIRHTYSDPGTYNVTITVLNRRGKRKDAAGSTITVKAPEKQEIIGRWRYYKEETVTLGVSVSFPRNELWVFGNEELELNGNFYNWSLAGNILTSQHASPNSFRILKFYNNEMELRHSETNYLGASHDIYHFRRE
ncbi:MAG: PKD domain-containing protein [Cytophagaceae bacterium]